MNKKIEDEDWYLKYISTRNVNKPKPVDNNGWKDANINNHLMNKMINNQGNNAAINSTVVYIKENVEVFKNLSVGNFYPKYPIVRSQGITKNNPNQSFELKGTIKCILVEGNNSIDLSSVEQNSDKLVELVELKAPFIGTILVKKESVYYPNTGKNVLLG